MNFKGRFITILIVFIFSLLIFIPSSWKSSAFKQVGLEDNPVAKFFVDQQVTLGLDLQGGTQLDYKVDLKGVPGKDQKPVIEGVKAVFERRVNGLGVSEPNIYQSTLGDEEHIIVELAGIKDINEAKKIIGKVIQLEFKETNSDQESDQKEQIKTQANDTLKAVVNAPEKFDVTGKESEVKDRVEYKSTSNFLDAVELPFKEVVKTLKENQVNPTLLEGSIESSFEVVENEVKQIGEKKGFFILRMDKTEKVLRPDPKNAEDFLTVAKEASNDTKQDLGYVRKNALPADLQEPVFALSNAYVSDVLDTTGGYYIAKMADKLAKDSDMVRARHILLQFKELKETKTIDPNLSAEEKKKLEDENKAITAENETITKYNKEELPKKAADLLAQLKADPSKFAALAETNSEDLGSKVLGGDLGYFGKGKMVKVFEDKAFAMQKDEISEPVESTFGYHIIQVTDKKAVGDEVAQVQLIRICYTGLTDCTSTISKEEAKKKADGLLTRLREETKYSYAYIYFSTKPDLWKPALAKNIKGEMEPLTGKFFKHADVEYNQQTMEPVVSIRFNDEGGKMFEELTGRLVNQPLAIFVGGELISSPNIRKKIASGSATISGNFTTEEAGKLARDLNAGAIPAPITLVGESQIGGQLGQEALNASIKAGMWGVIVLMIFLILYYRLPGFVASMALGVYIVLFIAFIKIWPGMVLTLAGIAGVILSIGMAVDANVLIFERIREELRAGKSLNLALKVGFDRAWTSIRDSNSSSLLTAFILIYFSSSIIKGFAFMLIVGVLLSLFSAIFTTRTLLQLFGSERYNKPVFWGAASEKVVEPPVHKQK